MEKDSFLAKKWKKENLLRKDVLCGCGQGKRETNKATLSPTGTGSLLYILYLWV
jgi:hypothetical protein